MGRGRTTGGGNWKPHFPECCAQARARGRQAPAGLGEAAQQSARPSGSRLGLVRRRSGLREPDSAAVSLARPGGTKRRDEQRTEVTGRSFRLTPLFLCAVLSPPAKSSLPQIVEPPGLVPAARGNSSPARSNPNSTADRVWAH